MIVTFTACIDFILLEQKTNLNLIKKYVKITIFAELKFYQKWIIYQNSINI